jgi:hypothetical protein
MVKHRSGTQWPSDREVEWHRVQIVPCTWRRGAQVSWFRLKTKVDGLSVIWPQNHWDGFSRFDLKIGGLSFSVWASKPAAPVWWFGPQNHCYGFLVWVSKLNMLRFVGCATKPMGGWFSARHTSRSGCLLYLKASQYRVFQFDLKTGRVVATGDTRGIIVEVASSESWRRMSWCDGLCRTFLSQNYCL